ncbi:lipid galactosyltransferase [soil metagenome]
MKIIIFTDDFPPKSFGGAGIIAFEQAKELLNRGHDVYVVTTVQEKNLSQKILLYGLTVFQIYSKYPSRWRAYFSIYNPQVLPSIHKILKDIKPDIVHAHNIHEYISYKSLDYASQNAKAVFITMHDAMSIHYSKIFPKLKISENGKYEFNYKVSNWHQLRFFRSQWNPFRNFLIKYYLKKVNKIFSVSYALAEALKQNGIRVSSVIHNGINPAEFNVSEEKRMLFINKNNLVDKQVLFFGGRLGKAKGGDVAIELLIKLSKKFDNVVLMIAGRGDAYVESLKEKIIKSGLEDNFRFIGWLSREEMSIAYSASDIVLSLSHYLDPFPTVNLEALTSGKPVLGSVFGGTSEIVQEGVSGYIINPNDISSVVFKCSKLLNAKLAKEMGNNGKERIKKDFLLSTQINKLEKIYEYYK